MRGRTNIRRFPPPKKIKQLWIAVCMITHGMYIIDSSQKLAPADKCIFKDARWKMRGKKK